MLFSPFVCHFCYALIERLKKFSIKYVNNQILLSFFIYYKNIQYTIINSSIYYYLNEKIFLFLLFLFYFYSFCM
jgi:predicted DsbA family dithiol-disulfide isomerase